MASSESDAASDGGGERNLCKTSLLAREEQFGASSAKRMAQLALMGKTGYSTVQVNGQRKYGPPPGWEGLPPARGCEVFVVNIPKEIYEDELLPLFERSGKIYEFRLMMEFSGKNRGYAFVMYTDGGAAQRAILMLNNYEIRPKKFIKVCVSLDMCQLFVGSIPKQRSRYELMEEMKKLTDGVVDVIMYPSSTVRNRNRGFAFIEYESHKAAALARKKLICGSFKLWGQYIQVDWAKPKKAENEEIMQHIRVIYVCNLRISTSEETLCEVFSMFKPGCVERVTKLSNYAFIQYHFHQDAIIALNLMNGAQIDGATVEVALAQLYWSKDGSAAGRRHIGQGIAAGGGNRLFCLQQNNKMTMGRPINDSQKTALLQHLLGRNFYPDHSDRCVLPLVPGTLLSPTSLQSVKQSQITSAVSLLELYCHKNLWSQPEYCLYSTPGHDGRLLLLYEVVITSTQSTFVPNHLCVLLDDAKELAAETALWNLGII